MTSATRTMAACLADAEQSVREPWASIQRHISASLAKANAVDFVLNWQRAKACLDQREAMQIVDDKTLDELSQLEHEARVAARSACEAVGIEWRNLGELS